jgi:hypothetical protein
LCASGGHEKRSGHDARRASEEHQAPLRLNYLKAITIFDLALTSEIVKKYSPAVNDIVINGPHLHAVHFFGYGINPQTSSRTFARQT